MATPVALAKRREDAAGRIAASLLTLDERFGLTVDQDALRGRGRDADQARTRQLETFADTLEQVVMLTTPEDVPETATPLVIDGVKPEHLEALAAAGITSLDDLRDASDEMILAVKGIGPATLERIRAHFAELDA
jgi:hypothetical protein